MTITPYPQTDIIELRRTLNEFSEAPRLHAAKPATTGKLSDVVKGLTTNEPQARAEYSPLLKSALAQTNELLRDYGKQPIILAQCSASANALCTELRALKAVGAYPESKDLLRVACALEDFLQTLGEKYPECMRDGRHPITNSMEKINTFIRQQAETEIDMTIGSARTMIEPVIKGQTNIFSVGEHNLPVGDSDHGFLVRASAALQEAQKYMEKTLQELSDDTQPGRNRLIEAITQLPTKTLQEYAELTPYSTQATVGGMLIDVRKSVDALRELGASKANDVLYMRCHKAIENAFKPPSALEI